MRTSRLIAVVLVFVFGAIAACKKYNYNGVISPASVTVINAMQTSNPIVPFFGVPPAQYWGVRQRIAYGASLAFSPPKDSNALLIVPITDTVFPIFQGKMPIVSGGIYSFYLAGDTSKPDTMFVKEDIPYYSDSASGLRFVNCAKGGKSINIINTANDPSAPADATGLGYFQSTGFKKYTFTSSSPTSYNYVVRDAASGDTLLKFSWAPTRFKNNTIVIAGNLDPASFAYKMIKINHY
jgi:hypothetical protein